MSIQRSVHWRGSCPELPSKKVPGHPTTLNTNPWCLKWPYSPRPSFLQDANHSNSSGEMPQNYFLKTWEQSRSTCTNLSWNWRLPKNIQPVSWPTGLKRVFLPLRRVSYISLWGCLGQAIFCASLQGGDKSYNSSNLANLLLNRGLQTGTGAVFQLPLLDYSYCSYWLQHVKSACKKQHLGLSLFRWMPQELELHLFCLFFFNVTYYH